jgi:hypothetical protein
MFNLGFSLNSRFDIRGSLWQSLLPVRDHDGGATYRLNRGQYNTVIALSFLYNLKPVVESDKKQTP